MLVRFLEALDASAFLVFLALLALTVPLVGLALLALHALRVLVLAQLLVLFADVAVGFSAGVACVTAIGVDALSASCRCRRCLCSVWRVAWLVVGFVASILASWTYIVQPFKWC